MSKHDPIEISSSRASAEEHAMKTLHVTVPERAWLNARTAALQSRMKFKDYITELLYLAAPFE